MKKLIFIIISIFASLISVSAQDLFVYQDTVKNYPEISLEYMAIDPNGTLMTNLQPSDFIMKCNGLQVTNLRTICGTQPAAGEPVSVVIVTDISSSMMSYGPRINYAKTVMNSFVEKLPLGQSECALVTFNDKAYLNQAMTTQRAKLQSAINALTPSGGTNYNEAFLNSSVGAIEVAKTGKHRKVIIFMTDGISSVPTDTNAIRNLAVANDITVYCACFAFELPGDLKAIITGSKGRYCEMINKYEQLDRAYKRFLMYSQGFKDCKLIFNDPEDCTIGLKKLQATLINPFYAQDEANAAINNDHLRKIKAIYSDYKCAPAGTVQDSVIKLSAKRDTIRVSSISVDNPNFTILNYGGSAPPFDVIPEQDRSLTVRYTSHNDKSDSCHLIVKNNGCTDGIFSLYKNCPAPDDSTQKLTLVFPNGFEKLVACTDTTIRWSGIEPDMVVKIEYTTDDGKTWTTVTDSASGLAYRWNVPDITGNLCKLRVKHIFNSNTNAIDSSKILGTAIVTCMDAKADGTQYAYGTTDGKVFIIDKATGNKLSEFKITKSQIMSLRWAPNSDIIAYYPKYIPDKDGGEATVIGAFNPITSADLGHFEGALGCSKFEWSPDGTALAGAHSVLGVQTLSVWNKNFNKLVSMVEQTGYISAIAWSNNGLRIASGADDSTTVIWDWKNNKVERSIIHDNGVSALAYNPDNSILAIGLGKQISKYNTATGALIQSYQMTTDFIPYTTSQMNWSSDGSTLFVAKDKEIAVINANNGNYIDLLLFDNRGFRGDIGVIDRVLFYPNTTSYFYCLKGGGAFDYNYATKQVTHEDQTISRVITSMAFNPSGTQIAVAELDMIKIWDLKNNSLLRIIDNQHTLTGLKWNPDGSNIAAISNISQTDQKLKVWDPATGALVQSIDNIDIFTDYSFIYNTEAQFSWNNTGTRLIVPIKDEIATFDCSNWSKIASYPDTLQIRSIVLSPDEKYLLVCAYEDSTRLFDMNSGKFVRKLCKNQNYANIDWLSNSQKFVNTNINNDFFIETVDLNGKVIKQRKITQTNSIDVQKANDFILASYLIPSDKDPLYSFSLFNSMNLSTIFSTTLKEIDTYTTEICQDTSKLIFAAAGTYNGYTRVYFVPKMAIAQTSDISDKLWSIFDPTPIANDIDLGLVIEGQYKDSVLNSYIKNNSGYPLVVDSITFDGPNANCFKLVSDFPPFFVPDGTSQNLEIRFTGNTLGNVAARLRLHVRCDTIIYNITGKSVEQQVYANYEVIDFGKVKVGTDKDTTIVLLVNKSTTNVDIDETNMTGPDTEHFTIVKGAAPFTLPAKTGTREFTLRFSPTDLGKTNGQIECVFNRAGSPVRTMLVGEGVNMAGISAPDSVYISQPWCEASDKDTTIIIRNYGDTALTVNSTQISGKNSSSFALIRSLTNVKLNPNQTDSVIVRFNANLFGRHEAKILFDYSSGVINRNATIALIGQRKYSTFELSKSTDDFGSVDLNSVYRDTITITNTSIREINWTTPIELGNFKVVSVSPMPIPANGGKAKLAIELQSGSQLNIAYDTVCVLKGECGNEIRLKLLANTFTSRSKLSAVEAIDYGHLVCGNANDTTLLIKNLGTVYLDLISVNFAGANPNEFVFVPEFTRTVIAPGDTKGFTLRFAPNSKGLKTATLQIKTNAFNVVDSIYAIALEAVKDTIQFALSSNSHIFSPKTPYDSISFVSTCAGAVSDTVITIENKSDIPARFSATSLSAPFFITGADPFATEFASGEKRDIHLQFASNSGGEFNPELSIADECGNKQTIYLIAKALKPIFNAGADKLICKDMTVVLGDTAKGGVTPYNYEWTPAAGLSDAKIANPIASPDKTTEYYVTVTDALGCVVTDSVIITVDTICDNKCFVYIENKEAQTGDKVNLPLLLKKSNYLFGQGIAREFEAKVTFNKTVLVPDFVADNDVIGAETRTIWVSGGISDSVGVLKNMSFIAALGNEKCTDLTIDEFTWKDISAVTTTENGELCLSNICEEGGTRLVNPTGTVTIKSISPNPASDKLTIDFRLVENDESQLELTNTLGEVVKSMKFTGSGDKTAEMVIDNLSSGRYLLIIKTPTIVISQSVLIVK